MPDRRRTAFRHPLPERGFMMLRDHKSSSPGSSPGSSSSTGSSGPSGSAHSPDSPDSPDSSGSPDSPDSPASPGDAGPARPDDNPFAAPPEGRPDQPWQPRHPSSQDGTPGSGDSDGTGSGPSDNRPVWGGQWSNQQPGRQNGGFGGRPGGPGDGGGKKGSQGGPGGLRWDPTDPVQRRARYSVLGGMWAFFFALFDFPEIALLLGALAVYWSISALRAKGTAPSTTGSGAHGDGSGRATAAQVSGGDTATPTDATGAAPAAGQGSRQQTTAAVSGLVTGLLALSIVAATFTVQLVYRDYYTCVNDALTKTGSLACNDQLPKPLEPFFGVKK